MSSQAILFLWYIHEIPRNSKLSCVEAIRLSIDGFLEIDCLVIMTPLRGQLELYNDAYIICDILKLEHLLKLVQPFILLPAVTDS